MQLLKQIRVAGWKSIKDQTVEFGPLSVIIGANGSGKSNLLSFFRLLLAVSQNNISQVVTPAGGASAVLFRGPKTTKAVYGEVEFSEDGAAERHGFNLTFAGGDKLIVDHERFSRRPESQSQENEAHYASFGGQFPRSSAGETAPGGEPVGRIRKLLSGIRVYHFHDTSDTARARLSCYIEDNNGLHCDAGNLAALLYLLRRQRSSVYRRILGAVRAAVPAFDDFVLEPQQLAPQNILLNWRQQDSDYLFGPHQFSDGSLRFIALATLLNQPPGLLPSVTVIDEPELGLHPAAVNLLAGMLRAAAQLCQVIVATQSVALLDEFDVQEVIVAEMRQGESVFRTLDAAPLVEWLESYSLSQLWEKNVIGGGPFG